MTWLESRKLADTERSIAERKEKGSSAAGATAIALRFHSRKGTYNTITFCDDDLFEQYFPDPESDVPLEPCKVGNKEMEKECCF